LEPLPGSALLSSTGSPRAYSSAVLVCSVFLLVIFYLPSPTENLGEYAAGFRQTFSQNICNRVDNYSGEDSELDIVVSSDAASLLSFSYIWAKDRSP